MVKASNIVGPTGKVIAIEPNPNNYHLLVRNIQANKLQNVVAIQKGIWSAKDRLKLILSPTTLGYSFYGGGSNFLVVEVDTLNNILKEIRIERVDFIKMNIEGSEVEALKGMTGVFKNDVHYL